MVNLAKAFLPTGLLSQLKHIKKMVNDTVAINNEQDFNSVWASIATSCNYVSPGHTDKDAFLSCLICSHVPKEISTNTKHFYKMEDKVACYFEFPEYGRAVALRSGDVLF